MLTVLINNYCRMLKRLPMILTMIGMMLAMIVLAIYVTSEQQVKAHIVYIHPTDNAPTSSDDLDITVMEQEPPLSALVRHQYDAYVVNRGEGQYEITTLKNEKFKAMLLSLLQHRDPGKAGAEGERGIGENIIGFLMMFLLVGSFMYLFTFAEDKEKGQLSRVTASPISLASYLLAHCIYCLTMFLPIYAGLVMMKLVAGVDIGFNLLQYGLLIFIMSILGISFALLLNMLFNKPDNAMMLGNSILALTSVLAGSFYAFSRDNPILDRIISILPQRQLLIFAEGMANHRAWTHVGSLIYVVLIAVIFFVISVLKLQKQYVRRH
ncbi:hypothetical protein DCC85_03965 [Paenibacillus sp. CAA11]|uniref:ABC transporter permease n=1 Tax=Paenibacillus sp. CAA11 TaxID=1532905 RepID=UPI000D33DEC4|nr:ABC transporter permease [Paenibacillus sp. CAA11]AWB43462.1 hypothetical protein DCC85_03965 [Paenibacillus sp. CAA11]